MTATFPKELRVLKRSQFQKIFKYGKKSNGEYVFVSFILGQNKKPKLGITVTTKFGNSVERNRFKRLVREAFRRTQAKLPQNIELNVSPKPLKANFSLDELQKDLLYTLRIK